MSVRAARAMDRETPVSFRILCLSIAVFVAALHCGPVNAASDKKVYYQWGLATATVGFDAHARKTLVSKYYLVATGPATIEDAAVGVVRGCLSASLKGAVEAFKEAPSPELSARLAAAVGSFKVSSYGCLQSRAVTRGLKKNFDLGLVERQEFLDGLVLKFNAESPAAAHYRTVNAELQKHFRGDGGRLVNRVVDLYASMQNFNFEVDLGRGDGAALAMRALDGRRVQLAMSAAADITEFAQHPLDVKKAEQLVKNVVGLLVDRKASLEVTALQAVGIPTGVAEGLSKRMKEAGRDPKVRRALKAVLVPQVALADALNHVSAAAKGRLPTVPVPGTKKGVIVTPVGIVPRF